ncbi:MAG: hypothetical protein Athens071426_554 [Parcubacteria group bacterium Athens0714_26]|nr:MAG: hypothetical protein Athens071426_554 [Parcubacteria group bacterium Athens0714_26]
MPKRWIIEKWYRDYAPGLKPQAIPPEAVVDFVLEPFIPYGIQYRMRLEHNIFLRCGKKRVSTGIWRGNY